MSFLGGGWVGVGSKKSRQYFEHGQTLMLPTTNNIDTILSEVYML